MLKHSECSGVAIARPLFIAHTQVEGKGIGFAHVSSSKGFKEINRWHGLEHLKLGIQSILGASPQGDPRAKWV